MKSLKVVLLFVASLGLLAYGCAKSDDSSGGSSASTSKYSRSNTPSKSSVSVPASLSGKGSSSRTANLDTSNAMFYSMLKGGVMMMKSSVSSADLNLMLVDARYSDTVMGTCYASGEYSLTFSQEMYNALVAMEQDFGGEEGASGSMSAQFKQYIGTELKPPVSYKLVDNLTQGGYKYELKVGESCSGSNVSGTGIETLRWDENKTKLQVAFDDSQAGSVMKGSFSYDSEKKNSTVNMTFTSGSDNATIVMNLSECSTSQASNTTGDCAIFGFTQKFSSSQGGSSFTAMIKAKGKADDKGGYGEADMSFTMSGTNMKNQYKEKWDGQGNLTYVAYKGNGDSSWSESGSNDGGYSESDYDAQGYTVTIKNSSDNSSFTAAGSYHVALEDPSSKPEAIVGYGEIRGADSFWDYWGADSTATHYLYGADNNSQISGVTITITAK